MTPVNQATLYSADSIGNGDCLVACMASLLDLPLWMVPPFYQMFGRSDWRQRVDAWLARMFGLVMIRTEEHALHRERSRGARRAPLCDLLSWTNGSRSTSIKNRPIGGRVDLASGDQMKLLLLPICVLAFWFQEPEGTAEKCSNMKGDLHPCACIRASLCKGDPDKSCKTFCRPDACSCKAASCNSMKMR